MGNVINDNTVIKQWRYKITKLTLKWPGSGNVEISPERVKMVQIIEDYENNVFPIFRLHVVVEPSTYYKILNQKKEISVTFKMMKFYRKSNESDASEHGFSEYISDVFRLVMNDDTADLLNAQKQEASQNNYMMSIDNDVNDMQKTDNTVEFYMFKKDSLDAAKAQISNAILKNCRSMADPIAYLFSTRPEFARKVLMAPPDDRPKPLPDEILIPPLSTLKAFLYLDNYYGIYKTGSIIYFGLEYIYIIPYSSLHCYAYTDGETDQIQIVVPKTDDVKDITIAGEIQGNDARYRVIADYRTVDIQNMSIANNYIEGNDAQVVDPFTGETTNYHSGAETNDSGNFTRTIENRSENPFIGNVYTAQSSSNSIVIKCVLQDIDSRYITPNKRYTFHFEDSTYVERYRGDYIITQATHTFTNTGGATTLTSEESNGIGAMNISVELTLKKTSF